MPAGFAVLSARVPFSPAFYHLQPTPFSVRGPTYLKDQKKMPAGLSQFVMAAMDVVEVPEPIQHVARFLPSVSCGLDDSEGLQGTGTVISACCTGLAFGAASCTLLAFSSSAPRVGAASCMLLAFCELRFG
eukprot:1159839-Pelagomonas_calceolata.AAC.4